MGSILKAICQCGFQANGLLAGGGLANSTTYCGAPALCDSCRSFSVLNYLKKDIRCEHCGGRVRFYNNPDLQRAPNQQEKPEVFKWGLEFSLPDTEYLCPKCGKMEMRFVQVALWD